MTRLLDHVWGLSLAQDRVWAEVAGLGPHSAGRRLLLVLQAFVDESYTAGGVFVLGGHIASAEAWAAFSAEWEEMLPHGTLNKHGRYHFKMSEMALSPERMGRVPGFFRIIERHVLLSISCKIDIGDLRRAINRISLPGQPINWEIFRSPYFMAFRCLMDMFHSHRDKFSEFIPINEKIDFFFDNHVEKRPILEGWDRYLAGRPDETRELYGAAPSFRNDEEFLPLQAADFWAWWVREWSEGPDAIEKMQDCDFGSWRETRKGYPKLHFVFNEDELVGGLISILRSVVGPQGFIYDVRIRSE